MKSGSCMGIQSEILQNGWWCLISSLHPSGTTKNFFLSALIQTVTAHFWSRSENLEASRKFLELANSKNPQFCHVSKKITYQAICALHHTLVCRQDSKEVSCTQNTDIIQPCHWCGLMCASFTKSRKLGTICQKKLLYLMMGQTNLTWLMKESNFPIWKQTRSRYLWVAATLTFFSLNICQDYQNNILVWPIICA